jgi:hypothetical protein
VNIHLQLLATAFLVFLASAFAFAVVADDHDAAADQVRR